MIKKSTTLTTTCCTNRMHKMTQKQQINDLIMLLSSVNITRLNARVFVLTASMFQSKRFDNVSPGCRVDAQKV